MAATVIHGCRSRAFPVEHPGHPPPSESIDDQQRAGEPKRQPKAAQFPQVSGLIANVLSALTQHHPCAACCAAEANYSGPLNRCSHGRAAMAMAGGQRQRVQSAVLAAPRRLLANK